MVSAVRTFDPQISVVLKKNVGRQTVAGSIAVSQRYSGTQRTIDLTPFLGDRSSVIVDKSIREPSGMFTIVIADRMASGAPISQFESLYGLIEPMDVIEIRMARDTSKYSGYEKSMPIRMRGFVTEPRRVETMTPSGPSRSVVITGQDYGKILQIMQIAYLPNEVTGQNLLTYFKFFQNYGVGAAPDKPASQFVQDVVTNVVLPFLSGMRDAVAGQGGPAVAQSPVLDLQVDATVQTGIISPFGTIETFEGTVGGLMAYYGDVGPWNELFVEDREVAAGAAADAPFLVYRPTPFKDPSGNLIQADSGAVAPAATSITDKEIVELSLGRSDAGVANYYWVDPVVFNLNSPGLLAVEAAHAGDKDRLYLSDYPNSSPNLYGFRRMQVQTQQGPRFDGQPESEYEKRMGVNVGFVTQRRDILMNNNRDNVVFEDGTMQIQGNEAIRAGTTVKVARGQASPWECYAIRVRDVFVPFRSYMTSVEFERGTSFINRIQEGAGSAPYLREINAGGVYA